MLTTRRLFLANLFVAPAIVHVENIMRVKSLLLPDDAEFEWSPFYQKTNLTFLGTPLYKDLWHATRDAFLPRLYQKYVNYYAP